MEPVIVISDRDNVATALEPLGVGEAVHASGAELVIVEPIPRGHKVALRAIRCGEPIVKYGSAIGTATWTSPPVRTCTCTTSRAREGAATLGRARAKRPA